MFVDLVGAIMFFIIWIIGIIFLVRRLERQAFSEILFACIVLIGIFAPLIFWVYTSWGLKIKIFIGGTVIFGIGFIFRLEHFIKVSFEDTAFQARLKEIMIAILASCILIYIFNIGIWAFFSFSRRFIFWLNIFFVFIALCGGCLYLVKCKQERKKIFTQKIFDKLNDF